MMQAPIFVSHSSKDQKVARTICTALENRGHPCWIYSRDIHPGQNFQEQIFKAIRAARIMVLVFTANANTSDEIKKELALASQNRLLVIPIRVEDVIPNAAFAYELATRQWIDVFDDWEASIASLIDLIDSAEVNVHPPEPARDGTGLSGNEAARPSFEAGTRPEKTPQGFRRALMIWAILGLALVVVIASVAYAVITTRHAPQSPMTAGTRTDVVTDCDRLAALPGDPQTPPGVSGVLSPFQIDVARALPACDAAMRQYPNFARFVYQAGRVAIAQQDYEKARRLYERAASGGSVGALNGLGYLYENGFGISKDMVEACDWYRRAAAQGNATAQGNVNNVCPNVPRGGSQ